MKMYPKPFPKKKKNLQNAFDELLQIKETFENIGIKIFCKNKMKNRNTDYVLVKEFGPELYEALSKLTNNNDFEKIDMLKDISEDIKNNLLESFFSKNKNDYKSFLKLRKFLKVEYLKKIYEEYPYDAKGHVYSEYSKYNKDVTLRDSSKYHGKGFIETNPGIGHYNKKIIQSDDKRFGITSEKKFNEHSKTVDHPSLINKSRPIVPSGPTEPSIRTGPSRESGYPNPSGLSRESGYPNPSGLSRESGYPKTIGHLRENGHLKTTVHSGLADHRKPTGHSGRSEYLGSKEYSEISKPTKTPEPTKWPSFMDIKPTGHSGTTKYSGPKNIRK